MKDARPTKFIRPAMIDVGRGEEPARITYSRGAHVFELPRDGAAVPWSGMEGSFWRRRVQEGGAEIVDPHKPKTKKKAAAQPKED